MQLGVWPIILSLPFLLGIASCEKKPDAFICTFILRKPIESSYSFCVNYKTKEEKNVPIYLMGKWVTTDPDSYETTREWYKNTCGSKK